MAEEIKMDQDKIKRIRKAIYLEEKQNEKDNFPKKDGAMVEAVKDIVKKYVDQKR